jgi:hypothetical protein
MRMFRCNFGAAQLATLNRPFAPHKLAKRTECIFVSRLNFIHHQVTNNSHHQLLVQSGTRNHASQLSQGYEAGRTRLLLRSFD